MLNSFQLNLVLHTIFILFIFDYSPFILLYTTKGFKTYRMH